MRGPSVPTRSPPDNDLTVSLVPVKTNLKSHPYPEWSHRSHELSVTLYPVPLPEEPSGEDRDRSSTTTRHISLGPANDSSFYMDCDYPDVWNPILS